MTQRTAKQSEPIEDVRKLLGFSRRPQPQQLAVLAWSGALLGRCYGAPLLWEGSMGRCTSLPRKSEGQQKPLALTGADLTAKLPHLEKALV